MRHPPREPSKVRDRERIAETAEVDAPGEGVSAGNLAAVGESRDCPPRAPRGNRGSEGGAKAFRGSGDTRPSCGGPSPSGPPGQVPPRECRWPTEGPWVAPGGENREEDDPAPSPERRGGRQAGGPNAVLQTPSAHEGRTEGLGHRGSRHGGRRACGSQAALRALGCRRLDGTAGPAQLSSAAGLH